MKVAETRPKSFFFDSVQSLLDWTPESQPFDAFNRALVPLRQRASSLEGGARLMDCNDFKGGYVSNSDLYPQGTDDADTYNFSFWQYMDSFCYFAHHRISVPTTWWINSAHQNGIPVTGTVIFEGSSGNDLTLMFSKSKGKPDQALAQLVALAEHYGFDGWFFNIEIGLNSNVPYTDVTDFLKNLLTGLQKNNANALVTWYDAVTQDGYVDYQNCLNSNNNVYFMASNGIFPNYWWNPTDGLLKTSEDTAKADNRSSYEVYSGVDVYGRGTYYSAGFPSTGAAGTAADNGTSVGLFAPGWTFENAPGTGSQHHENFEKYDTEYWIGKGAGHGAGSQDCIAQYIGARPIPSPLPFFTNFDRGRGSQFAVHGQQVSTQAFSNLGLQSLQPTYRFWAVEGNNNAFTIDFTTDKSYDGGAALKILGQSATAEDSVTYRLFNFSSKLQNACQVNAVFQPLENDAPFPGVQIKLIFNDGTSFTTSTEPTLKDGWYSISETIGSSNIGKTLAQLCLVIGPSFNGNAPEANYGLVIGALSIWAGTQAQSPGSVQNLQGWRLSDNSQNGLYLIWNSPNDAARFYDIWQMDGNGNSQWLMRVCANAAWIEKIIPKNGSNSVTVGVQPVSYGFVPQPAQEMATVTVSVADSDFDDTGTAKILGAPKITKMVIWSGEVLDAIQVTNDPYEMPQHGGSSGSENTFQLQDDDFITEVSGYTGVWYGWHCVVQLTIKTHLGKTGTYGSMTSVQSKQPFSYVAKEGEQVLSFSGSTINVPLASGDRTDIIATLNVHFAKKS